MKKDLEWLKEEVKKDIGYKHMEGDIYYVSREHILGLIDQLDEPEVLSQEWIDRNKEPFHHFETKKVDYYVSTDFLQSLLVPKQELPVIPQFVAEWISKHRERLDLYPALKRLENNALSWEDVYEWYRRNTYIFVNAYLTGKYEVEQKYYVLDKKGHLLIRGFSDGTVGRVGDRMKPDLYPDWNKKNLPLTEQEIKDYDERYIPFMVPVDEVNND